MHDDEGSIPGLAHWVRGSGIDMSYSVVCRHGSDPEQLWLWRGMAAVAQFNPKPGKHAAGMALENQKKRKKERKEKK